VIEVRREDLSTTTLEAVVRPIRSDGEAVNQIGRRLEIAAGPELAERLRELGEFPVGGAVLTPAGNLSTSFVIHVVVQSPDEPVTPSGVRRGLVNALRRASELGIASLALPPVGMGPGNLDAEDAARILNEVLTEHHEGGENPRELLIVVESEYEEEVFGRLISGR
jgi:O-acetyl-ADP-ribose deacetylase (regulator of RNase III)